MTSRSRIVAVYRAATLLRFKMPWQCLFSTTYNPLDGVRVEEMITINLSGVFYLN